MKDSYSFDVDEMAWTSPSGCGAYERIFARLSIPAVIEASSSNMGGSDSVSSCARPVA